MSDKKKRINREKHDQNFDNMMKKAGFEKNSAGKGDSPRPVNKNRYDRNYRYIFGHD